MALEVRHLRAYLHAVRQAKSALTTIVDYAVRVTKGTSSTAARAAKVLLLAAFALESGCDEAKLKKALAEHDWPTMEKGLGEVVNGSQLSKNDSERSKEKETIWTSGNLSYKHLGADIVNQLGEVDKAARYKAAADTRARYVSGAAPAAGDVAGAAPRALRCHRGATDQDGSGGDTGARYISGAAPAAGDVADDASDMDVSTQTGSYNQGGSGGAPVPTAPVVKRTSAKRGTTQRAKRPRYGGNRAVEELLVSTLQTLQQRGDGDPHLPELVLKIADVVVKSEHLTGGVCANRLKEQPAQADHLVAR